MSDRTIDAWDRINGWSKVPDPIAEVPGVEDNDKWMEAAGFDSWLNTANSGVSSLIEFQIRQHSDGRFLVHIETFGEWAPILIPDLPSMMEFLRLYTPVLQITFMSEIRELVNELRPLLTDPDHGLLRDQVCGIEQRRRDQVEYYRRKGQEKVAQ